jgi:hypothetical protein
LGLNDKNYRVIFSGSNFLLNKKSTASQGAAEPLALICWKPRSADFA